MAEDAWQSAWVEVLPDFSDFSRNATPQIKRHLSAAGDAGGQAGAQTFGASFSSGIRGIGGLLAGAVASLGIGYLIGNAIRDGFDWVSEGITLASDLSESINAVQRSYEGAADAVLALGEDSANTFGLTRAELNASAVQFSNFAKTIAGDGGDVAGTFRDIAERGVDFASVLNLDVSDALAKFQSGLAGETEPLRQYGIDLSAAAVTNYALANGIATSAAEMTEAQKVQARYGLLMQSTEKYAGDFAATSDGLANSQRRLNASLTEVQTSAGEIFLPLMTQLANVANDELVPALSAVVEQSGPGLAASLADSVPALVEFLETLIPLLPELTKLGAEALPILITAGRALLPLLQLWVQKNGALAIGLNNLFALINGDISLGKFGQEILSVTGWIGDFWRAAYDASLQFQMFAYDLGIGVSQAVALVGAEINQIVGFIQSLPQRALDALGNIGAILYRSGQALIGGFIDGITSMIGAAGDAVGGVLEWVQGFFPSSPAERGPFSGSGWYNLPNSGAAVFDQWISGFDAAAMSATISPALGSVSPAVSTALVASIALGETGGGFVNKGTIQVTDERALVEYVETKRRRSLARAGI